MHKSMSHSLLEYSLPFGRSQGRMRGEIVED